MGKPQTPFTSSRIEYFYAFEGRGVGIRTCRVSLCMKIACMDTQPRLDVISELQPAMVGTQARYDDHAQPPRW